MQDYIPVWLGLVGIIGSPAVVGLITASLVNRHALAVKKLDWEREDKVAEKAAHAAELLVQSNRLIADTARIQGAKIEQIHTLVNSNMTAEMQKSLMLLKANLALLEKLFDSEPTADAQAVITATKNEIAEAEIELGERIRNTETASRQIEKDLGGRNR